MQRGGDKLLNLRMLAILVVALIVSISVGVAQAQVLGSVNVTEHAELGNILTDTDGNTLYLFTRDEREVSNCSGGCANAWPPLLTDGAPVAGEGVAENRLGTISREDGSTQVTFNGWPLYRYSQDNESGDANGQDANDIWYVVSPFAFAPRSGRSCQRNGKNCGRRAPKAWPRPAG